MFCFFVITSFRRRNRTREKKKSSHPRTLSWLSRVKSSDSRVQVRLNAAPHYGMTTILEPGSWRSEWGRSGQYTVKANETNVTLLSPNWHTLLQRYKLVCHFSGCFQYNGASAVQRVVSQRWRLWCVASSYPSSRGFNRTSTPNPSLEHPAIYIRWISPLTCSYFADEAHTNTHHSHVWLVQSRPQHAYLWKITVYSDKPEHLFGGRVRIPLLVII